MVDIIGGGPKKDELVKLAHTLGVEKRVNFIDWIDHSRLHENLMKYRALVSPSLADAGATTVQEAMAIGLPVICLDWGGPALYVDQHTGILIEPKNEAHVVEQLASAMDALCENCALAEEMSIKCREKAEDYRWSKAIEEWTAIYTGLCAGKRQRWIPSGESREKSVRS
ncbi:MAG: glycosyltransferase [Bradymonadales bacterium]|nr:glycosyltransferase [Bradymonadales bacterium]